MSVSKIGSSVHIVAEILRINFKQMFLFDIDKYSSANWITDKRDQLPDDIVICTSDNSVKNKLDRLVHETGFL